MAIHATARSEYAIRRLVIWATALTLAGAPTGAHVDEDGRAAETGPWVRLTFDELEGRPMGRFSATQTAIRLGLLMTCDVMWPHPGSTTDTAIRPHRIVADELREALQFLRLDFTDYTTPASQATVTDAPITCVRVDSRRVADSQGFRRHQVRGYVRWVGRFDDHFA